jgi:hypothetical protein
MDFIVTFNNSPIFIESSGYWMLPVPDEYGSNGDVGGDARYVFER